MVGFQSKGRYVNKDEEAEIQKIAEEINKQMRESLSRMAGDEQDSVDIAYVMAQAYFRMQGCRLMDDKVYSGEKHIADLVECDHTGKELILKVQYKDPLHVLVLDFEVEKDGKSKD